MTDWSPIRQWTIAMSILAMAIIFRWMGFDTASYYTIYVSLVMLAFMNPIINALRPDALKNLGLSIVIFIVHAWCCFYLLHNMEEQPLPSSNLFLSILVFYGMATLLSLLFRGIYLLLNEGFD